MKELEVALGDRSYKIYIERGTLERFAEIFGIADKRAFIITDSGVPSAYAKRVASGFSKFHIYTVAEGEGSKSLNTFSEVSSAMISAGMTRSDICIGVGGGVVGDLTGFVAATYMRGIDFYNIPTTILSAVDSSIGGKTAVNHAGIKNIIGAFHQPKGVLIDADTFITLPKRQWSNGLAEAIKMAMTSDKSFFEFLQKCDSAEDNIELIIENSLKIKRAIVQMDEREGGIRKILNFGHTFGHAIEALYEMDGYYHGECVAMGIFAVTDGYVKKLSEEVMKKYSLPTSVEGNVEAALKFISSDKKCLGDMIDIILVPRIGEHDIQRMRVADFCELIRKNTMGGRT